jgi:recombinational DNA repair protein (RecF pathway)
MLKDFQQHLSSISSDIQSLQQQSIEMNVQLKNKQAVRSELSQYVDEMVVPEVMIRSVTVLLW